MVKKLLALLFTSVLVFPLFDSGIRAGGWCSGQGREGDAMGGRYREKQYGQIYADCSQGGFDDREDRCVRQFD